MRCKNIRIYEYPQYTERVKREYIMNTNMVITYRHIRIQHYHIEYTIYLYIAHICVTAR